MNRHRHPEDPRASDPPEAFIGEASDAQPPEEASPPEPLVEPRAEAVLSLPELEKAALAFATARDPRSFNLLYMGTWRAVLEVVLRAGVDDDEAEDLVNLVFLTVWQQRMDIKGRAYKQFLTFARKIAMRRAVDWQRGNEWRNQIGSLAANPEEHCVGDDDCDPNQPTPEELAAGNEAMSLLSPREQEVVVLRAEGMTWKEIAAETGVSAARVLQIYSAAVKRANPEEE